MLRCDDSLASELDAGHFVEAARRKNGTNFRKILARLHSARLIEHAADGACTISPSGLIEAEGIIRDLPEKTAAKKTRR